MQFRRREHLAAICIATLILCAVYDTLNRPFDPAHADFTSAKAHWLQLLSAASPDAVRADFDSLDVSPAQGHLLAHALGEALFESKGLDGVVGCDERFLHGCFHQFAGDAIAHGGISVADDLLQRCAQEPLTDRFGCMHGVGHGLLGFYGYTPEDLQTALSRCAHTTAAGQYACDDGVFMEYNLRELSGLGSDLVQPRPYADAEAFTICRSRAGIEAEACIRELPNWWMTARSGSSAERASFAGSKCATLSEQSDTCFSGLGHIVPPSADYDPAKERILCETAAKNHAQRVICLTAAAQRVEIEHNESARQRCAAYDLTGTDLARCATGASAISNI